MILSPLPSNPLRARGELLGSREYAVYASTNRRCCQWTALVFPRPRLDTSSGEQRFSDCARRRGLTEPVLGKADLPWQNLLMKMRSLFILIMTESASGHRVVLLVVFLRLRLSLSHLSASSSDTTCRARETTTPTKGWDGSGVVIAANPATSLLRVLGRRSRGSVPESWPREAEGVAGDQDAWPGRTAVVETPQPRRPQ